MQQRSRRLEGKVAIVTGGSRGLGEAISVVFALEGAKVFILDVDEQLGPKVEKYIKSKGGEAKFIKHDVTDPRAWKTAVDTVLSTSGKINILVNNAAVPPNRSDVTEMTLEEWRRVNAVSAEGVFLGIQAVLPVMKKNDQMTGSIINMSSIGANIGINQGGAQYVAAKGAVRSFTKAVAAELIGTKIRTNSVHPGFIDTPLLRGFTEIMPDKGVGIISKMEQQGVFGEPNDVAYACLYLASDESKFVNGIELIVDGGFMNVAKL